LFLIDNTENTQEIHKWDSDDACAHSWSYQLLWEYILVFTD
jgi:hypothetical protein